MASRSWNRVELIGNLTRDPELRFTPSGAAVCTIGLATNRTYVSEGERKEEVDFHRIVAWNKLAELCSQLLRKGSRVFMSGRLQYREWETQDGQKRRDAEMVLEDMILLTPKNGAVEPGEDISEEYHSGTREEAPAKVSEPVKSSPPPAKSKSDSSAAKSSSVEAKDEAKTEDEVVNEDDLPF